MSRLKSGKDVESLLGSEIVIAQQVSYPSPLAEEYANDTAPGLKGQVEESTLKGGAKSVTLKGTVQKGDLKLIPQRAADDENDRPESAPSMEIRGWEYVAMPPTEGSPAVLNAYADEKGKWYRGRHRIPVSIDLDGDHEGDAYGTYPLMWSFPHKLKLADSREKAVEVVGKIMLRNERAELVETQDWYRVKLWDDHIDNLAHNIRADGFIMHFDEKSQTWWKLGQLKYYFNHEEGRGNCYGPDVPATSEWSYPDNLPNTVSPTLYGDYVRKRRDKPEEKI
jgi:hypothetical protein